MVIVRHGALGRRRDENPAACSESYPSRAISGGQVVTVSKVSQPPVAGGCRNLLSVMPQLREEKVQSPAFRLQAAR